LLNWYNSYGAAMSAYNCVQGAVARVEQQQQQQDDLTQQLQAEQQERQLEQPPPQQQSQAPRPAPQGPPLAAPLVQAAPSVPNVRSYAAAASPVGGGGPAARVTTTVAPTPERLPQSRARAINEKQPEQPGHPALPTARTITAEEEQNEEAAAAQRRSIYVRMTGGDSRWVAWNRMRDGRMGRRVANWLCYFSVRAFGAMSRDAQDRLISTLVKQMVYVAVLRGNDSRKESNAKVVFQSEGVLTALLSSLKAKVTRHDVGIRDQQGTVAARQFFTYGTSALPETTQLPPQPGDGGAMAQLLMRDPSVAADERAAEQPVAVSAEQLEGGRWQYVGDGRRGARGKRQAGRKQTSLQRGAAGVEERLAEAKEVPSEAAPHPAPDGNADASPQQAGDVSMDAENSNERRSEPVPQQPACFSLPSSLQ
jgi:hypothetical protein